MAIDIPEVTLRHPLLHWAQSTVCHSLSFDLRISRWFFRIIILFSEQVKRALVKKQQYKKAFGNLASILAYISLVPTSQDKNLCYVLV